MPIIQKDTYAELCLKSNIRTLRAALASGPIAADMYEWCISADEWTAQVELALSVMLTTMTPEQFENALVKLKLTKTAAARVLGVSRETIHKYAKSGPPGHMALLLRMLLDMPEEGRSRYIPQLRRPT